MTIWNKYSKEKQNEYIKFLQVYGALSNLFRQKHGDMIPYLDSKFQETIYAKIFNAENVDIGNTPHDVLSIFSNQRIGIGLKTWMNSKPSYQKVMQLKRYKKQIDEIIITQDNEALAYKLSSIKNERMKQDYERLGLTDNSNIYHYVTRDEGKFILQESAYPLIELNNLSNFNRTATAFSWSDGLKEYKFTFGDSQIWQKFSMENTDTTVLNRFDVNIIDDPFQFLMEAYSNLIGSFELEKDDITVAYLPMYSYRSKQVEAQSGLNMWNGSSKNKGSNTLRPEREIYIPIPMEFHRKFPDFFTENILDIIKKRRMLKEHNRELPKNRKIELPQIRFTMVLPNGKEIPGLITADNMKQFQSGGYLKNDNHEYGQSDLGRWLLDDVLKIGKRQSVTREWLDEKGTDAIKLWYNKNDKKRIYIDFAPVGAFEEFMNGSLPNEIDEFEN